jgi:phage repressor protein C with HTH and peptisase S24 domain
MHGVETIGERVKRLRLARGWTQQQLAARAGRSQVTISDIERGRNKSSRDLVGIADALDVSAQYLSSGKGEPTSGTRGLDKAVRSPSAAYTAGSVRIEAIEDAETPINALVNAVDVSERWIVSNIPDVRDVTAIRLMICPGDTMAPTFGRGDILLIDSSIREIEGDGVYAYRIKDDRFVTRIQRLPDGGVKIISDNPLYAPHVLPPNDRIRLRVDGRVVFIWAGRRL